MAGSPRDRLVPTPRIPRKFAPELASTASFSGSLRTSIGAASQPEAADLLPEAGVRPELPSGPQAWKRAGIFMEVRLAATSADVCRRVMLSAIAVLRGSAGRTSTSSRSG